MCFEVDVNRRKRPCFTEEEGKHAASLAGVGGWPLARDSCKG
jgi:hypothetical protein